MNIQAAITKTFKLIDSYSRKGVLLDPNDTKQKDYTLKMPDYFDTAQKKIATIKKIVKTRLISHAMPTNKLADADYQFDIVRNTGDDQIYEIEEEGNAYYFEVDDVCQVLIEEETSEDVWTILVTINNPLANAGLFTPYKGILTPSSQENNIRIRFVGGTTYSHRNRALFSDKFSDLSRVPDYNEYVLYKVDPLFYQLHKVLLKGQKQNFESYRNTEEYYWEQRDTIAINWYSVGEYSIEYYAYPATITEQTPLTTEFEIDIEAQELIPMYAASILLINENNIVGDRLMNEFNNGLANLNPYVQPGSNRVENTMFTGPNVRRSYLRR